jgi:leucyl/phenylalanyl-tRNA--protein transferase
LRATSGWDRTPESVGECAYQWPAVDNWPEDDDLIGQGADLHVATLIDGYKHGLFAMERAVGDGTLFWWSPAQRCIIPLDGLRVTRSMRRSARRYHLRINSCFERVMLGCASRHGEDGRWITARFVEEYCRLHELGWAHSVETFNDDGVLVGGLYGVRIGKFFAGESMFHLERDASKVALMALVDVMRSAKMLLLDAQWHTPHLESLGGITVPRAEYLARLEVAVGQRG